MASDTDDTDESINYTLAFLNTECSFKNVCMFVCDSLYTVLPCVQVP